MVTRGCTLVQEAKSEKVADKVFFFQAEDGIRDGHVTGVQTCALPILTIEQASADIARMIPIMGSRFQAPQGMSLKIFQRSEERRVGKECRSRRSRDLCKK